MIIPRLFFQDSDTESGKDFLRPATTEDICWIVGEYYENSITVGELRAWMCGRPATNA